jgi:hypothetical protein
VRVLVVERRTGDVHVRPGDPVRDELLEEQSGDEHAAVAVAGVDDVGDIGVDGLAQLRRQRHRPHLLAREPGSGADASSQLVVVRHDAGGSGAERTS